MKRFLTVLILAVAIQTFGQVEILPPDSLKEYDTAPIPVYTQDYMRKYNRMKRIVVKVYPYALHAADVIDEIDQNAERIERRRKKNRFYKQSYKELKENFKYFILDLYTSEGAVLMKLIHRETGMTVYDISLKYRGKQKAEMFDLMAKVWDQDLHAEFDPSGEDKIVEHVISDIQTGRVEFNNEIVTVDKLTYKEKKKKDKKRKKENRKKNKDYQKKKKKREKERKKIERKKARHK